MAAQTQSIPVLEYFSGLKDPRQSGKVLYPLEEIMLLVLCGQLAGADGFVETARWGAMNLDFLRRFRPFVYGVPSHDALSDLFNALDAEAFRDAFIAFAQSLRTAGAVDPGADHGATPEIVAVDGKTSRRTGDKAKGRAALHLVSAWATEHRIVLGQEAVDGKENEIVAIPRLLEMLELTGALVTIDAMGCQKAIAKTIRDKGADYLLPVKDNQPSLHEDIKVFFDEQRERDFADCSVFFHETTDQDHGRLEIRRHWSTGDIAWLAERHPWAGLASIAMIERVVERDGKTETSRHVYISSLPADAVLIARAARAHWGIENRLHWILDVVFHDDLCRMRTGHGPQNAAIVRHIALNLLKTAKDKHRHSLKVTRKMATWSNDFLYYILTGNP
jgi:predicted transposase YbfD/YdcC